ncbi:hypothetical protein BBF96_06575 [Anoxybacter fermentans]|uniref:Uncharacterized protein n=1 Tax=Anoxybacter fermentans TaxID=1323375 RepID=A0A3Q9HPY5_9FIRM|nr:hypothetical protein [Anoxybacter fermentans]AZR73078.1 hypothetical protein BBF96_06575 [Anoxybacter fermentans]
MRKLIILKARMADIITDGLRSLLLESLGYDVSIIEYISSLETPKNLMIRVTKVRSKSKEIFNEYKKLKKLLNVKPSLEKLINNLP